MSIQPMNILQIWPTKKDSKILSEGLIGIVMEDSQKAYSFDGENWEKLNDVEIDVVFDKYRFDEQTIGLKKEIDDRHPVLNSFEVEQICKDKLLAYEKVSGKSSRDSRGNSGKR